MLTDSHCHLQHPLFEGVLPNTMAKARGAGVTRFVCCATSELDWDNVLALAKQEDGLIPMLGQHPWYLGRSKSGWDIKLFDLLQGTSAGVGECGLDFAIEGADKEAQMAALEPQWRMAVKLGRPMSLHCRKAFDAIFELSKKMGLPSCGAVIHAFSGSAEQAIMAAQHGFYISFACSLMNPNNKRVRKAILATPQDRLLLETDSPDISPTPGTVNEPANLAQLLNCAAEQRGEAADELAQQIERNADRVFRF
ncbi:MAG: TatD family hydrolase [Holophagales bacterium]|nr:TatD family hydrolase [Holophagales bacterium]